MFRWGHFSRQSKKCPVTRQSPRESQKCTKTELFLDAREPKRWTFSVCCLKGNSLMSRARSRSSLKSHPLMLHRSSPQDILKMPDKWYFFHSTPEAHKRNIVNIFDSTRFLSWARKDVWGEHEQACQAKSRDHSPNISPQPPFRATPKEKFHN